MAPRTPTRRVIFNRRDALKLLQVGGLGTAAATLGLLGRPSTALAEVHGQCRLCTMHCGVVAHVRGDRLERMEGDPDTRTRGFICQHGMAAPQVVHHQERIKNPLRRRGNDLEEISWDVALAEVAGRMSEIRQRHGARAVAIQTGWPFVRHPMVPFLQRFCHCFGTPNLATVASLCESSGRLGRALTGGVNWWPDVGKARTLVVWGANPPITAPPFTALIMGTTRGNRHLVVVDPVKTDLAARAHLHLQVKPGTDTALALGMIREVLAQGWEDRAFVEKHVHGLPALTAAAQDWTLEATSQTCGVPAADIQQAAQWLAQDGPGAVWEGLGVEHHAGGLQTTRAVACLLAVCGHLDVPGGATMHGHPAPDFAEHPLPMAFWPSTPKPAPPPLKDQPIGASRFPLFTAAHHQAQGVLFAQAIIEEEPYPLRGLILWASNALLTFPDAQRQQAAAEKLDLLVSVDPFLNASGERADYVLPSTTFADGPVVRGDGELEGMGATAMVHSPGNARTDWEILRGLAHALDMKEYFPWVHLADAAKAPRQRLPVQRHPALAPLPELKGQPPPRFATATGKVEVESTVMARMGLHSVPHHVEPHQDPGHPLRLVSGPRGRVFINSQFHQVPSLARQWPAPQARVHPDTATAHGVGEATRVAVVSPRGRLVMDLLVDAAVRPGVVVIPAGWAHANANLLVDTERLDEDIGFPVFRSGCCKLEPA